MRLLWYNIQDPLDPQVNGFSFYRTAVDGVIPLLVEKKHLGGRSTQHPSVEFAITHPWEASDCTDQELVPIWTNPTQYKIGTDSSPTACTSSNIWEVDPILHSNNEDTYRATQPWEHDFLTEYLGRTFVQNHITWAFSSTIEDDALGVEVEYDNDVPVGNHLLASFQEGLFTAGDPDNPHFLYYTKRFRPESLPTDNYLEIGTANDPITALVTIAGLLGLFTRDTKYRLSGNATTGFTHYEAISRRGTRATKSVTPSDKGIIFVANDGVYTTNLVGPDNKISAKIESLFSGDIVSEEDPINQDAMDQISASYYKNKYYFIYPTTGETVPNRMAIYSFDTEDWTIYEMGGGSMLYEPDTDALILGGDDGFCYILESGVTDNGSAIEAEVSTKEFTGGSYNANSLFLYTRIDCQVADGTSLTVEFYVDGTVRQTFSIATTSRTNNLYSLPEGTFGKRWKIRMTISDDHGTTAIYGVAAMFIPLASS